MKLKTLAILFILLPILFLASCAEDDTEDPNNGVSDGELTSCLVGTFKFYDYDHVNFSFNTNKNFTIEDNTPGDYEYIEGSWNSENNQLELIYLKIGSSTMSIADAKNNAENSPLKIKTIYPNFLCSDKNLALYSYTGGDSNTLQGTWGSISEPEYKEYILDNNTYRITEEDYFSIKLADPSEQVDWFGYDKFYYGCSDGFGNYDPSGELPSGDCSNREFYSNPTYISYNEVTGIVTDTFIEPTNYSKYSDNWSKINNTITLSSDVDSHTYNYLIIDGRLILDYLIRQ